MNEKTPALVWTRVSQPQKVRKNLKSQDHIIYIAEVNTLDGFGQRYNMENALDWRALGKTGKRRPLTTAR